MSFYLSVCQLECRYSAIDTHFKQTLQDIRAEINRLQALATEIRGSGNAIISPDFWLDSTGNGKTQKRYYRKRWFDSDGNKFSESLSREAYAELGQAIARGRQLQKIEQQISRLQLKQLKILEKLAVLGIDAAKIEL